MYVVHSTCWPSTENKIKLLSKKQERGLVHFNFDILNFAIHFGSGKLDEFAGKSGDFEAWLEGNSGFESARRATKKGSSAGAFLFYRSLHRALPALLQQQ